MSILTTVKPVRYPGRQCARPPRADLPAAPGLALTTRRGAKVLQPPAEPPKICRQTAITIAPDIGARYRQDLPYGCPAWHKTYATLRNTIEGLNGLRQRPRPRSPRPARPAPRPRHRRPVHLHRAAADGREHPQDPRLARPHRPRQGPHHPAGTAAPDQPARLPPRRLTGTAPSATTSSPDPARQATPQTSPHAATGPRHSQTRPHGDQRHCQTPAPYENRPPPQFCRYDTGSSVGNPSRGAKGTRTPDPLLAKQMLFQLSYSPGCFPKVTCYSSRPGSSVMEVTRWVAPADRSR